MLNAHSRWDDKKIQRCKSCLYFVVNLNSLFKLNSLNSKSFTSFFSEAYIVFNLQSLTTLTWEREGYREYKSVTYGGIQRHPAQRNVRGESKKKTEILVILISRRENLGAREHWIPHHFRNGEIYFANHRMWCSILEFLANHHVL